MSPRQNAQPLETHAAPVPRARGTAARKDRGAARDGAGAGFTLAKGQVLKTAQLNRLLPRPRAPSIDELINITTLRSMTQAYYSPENFGHFGLALRTTRISPRRSGAIPT
jgi:hypothetical protein